MSKDDEYRRNAEDARQWAARVRSESDRAAWLKIAQDWLALIDYRDTQNQGRCSQSNSASRGLAPQDSKN